MKLDAPKNKNYAAQVVRVPATLELKGLDNLVGVPVLGCQALTQRDTKEGDLRIAFTVETQLSTDYAHYNNLFRDAERNEDPNETGYLENHRRIKAMKLRGHKSSALLMPLESVAWTGVDPSELQEGDTFDTLNGHEICRKYELPVKHTHGAKASKVQRAFKRVDAKVFPEHLDTDNFFRSAHLLEAGREVIVTQKLHGTSIRVGNVPVLRRKKWLERFINRWVKTPDYEFDVVYGSRKVIKDVNNPNQNHYYQSDIWTEYGKKIAALIPEGFIVYGELIGWTSDGAPLQKGYTYDVPRGEAHLYVYRVAHINSQGHLSDLSWDGVKQFCQVRGLKWTPEMDRVSFGGADPEYPSIEELTQYITQAMDMRYADHYDKTVAGTAVAALIDRPISLSDKKSVDEGVCLRQDGLVPTILKAKSPKFFEYETKLLDSGEVDTESAA
ncbi:RNA ligase [Mycobacterium phage Gage]|uniref:RNA ligase n=1 Tax=Mycobacterium phage Murphy TaxID=1327939 RepID=UPI000332B37B|nr:RNA ligase [Mycobacterium phage Murphy]AVE00134.1 RNA ligase [Mycobacterium phage Kimchi]AVI03987.1 RNA ligase [Mycobacterium phage Gage]AXQ63694.1 RNA ligase [Mycobacterium phage Easy2Say]QGJ92348.1 RNA ligase [Mycobacterium phage OrionPax]QGJ94410.1 RNA ligase [Mycobacterium phage ChosenOne]QGJ95161.1 RNA ligase [Mycobacterium phage Elite2014]QGJ96105.1 RNA ligase [Mycobacterium phage Lilpickle]QGJ96250.1 RNA ligase [Mycobacterium phage Myrale]WNN94925.1 RNA ligase [Mycobacterium phag